VLSPFWCRNPLAGWLGGFFLFTKLLEGGGFLLILPLLLFRRLCIYRTKSFDVASAMRRIASRSPMGFGDLENKAFARRGVFAHPSFTSFPAVLKSFTNSLKN